METLRKASFFVLATLVVTTTCCAQTAEDIVAKNLLAIGGKDVVTNTKSVVITSNLEVMGNDVPTTTTIVAGKGFKSETDFKVLRSCSVLPITVAGLSIRWPDRTRLLLSPMRT